MRKEMAICLVSFGFLAGCGAGKTALVMYKENVSYDVGNKALLDCQVAGAQKVPVRNNIYTKPTWTTPVSCSVSSDLTSCSGGVRYGGNMVTQDLNSGLRDRVTKQCLKDKGYFVGEAPICNAGNKRKHIKNSDIQNFAPYKLMTKPENVLCVFYDDGVPVVVENPIQDDSLSGR